MNNKLKYLEDRIELINLEVIAILLIFSGALFNIYVISLNNCKMPVYVFSDVEFDNVENMSEEHFPFKNYSEVNKPFLSDIFRFKFGFFSLGDFLFSIGFIIMIIKIIKEKRLKNKWLY